MGLGLSFRCLIHFEFIFVYVIRKHYNFIFIYSCLVFSEPLIGETVFFPLYILASFAID